ncbi:MAG: hypothetical protein AB2552_05710 [Candidatus Thiodiazotropha endolucinida]
MIKVVFVSFMLAAILAACSSTQMRQFSFDAVGVGTSLKVFDQTLDLAVEAISRNSDLYTEDEWARLADIRSQMETLRTTLQSMFDQPGDAASIVLTADQMTVLYLQAKQAYLDARALVEPRFHELPPADQQLLLNLNRHAMNLDARMSRLPDMPDGTDQTENLIALLTVVTLAAQTLQ